MKFNNPYWSNRTKIELLEKWILIHSIVYYKLDSNIVPDHVYDGNAKQLGELLKCNQDDLGAIKWHYVFGDDFGQDGCLSGYNLIENLTKQHKKELMKIAKSLLKELKGDA